MKILPKKRILNVQKFRAISLKPLLAKIYDSILMKRLYNWIYIPNEQTAYQKDLGCFIHVFFIRTLISICKKNKSSLFIGITDFRAAFDSVSRLILFQKLIKLGIGFVMLNALKEMYSSANVCIEMNGEYSHSFELTAGVIQGSSTSTILFIAYSMDIINLFMNTFESDDYI